MAHFQSLERTVQTALGSLERSMLHIQMDIDNIRARQLNAGACRCGDSIRPLQVLRADGTSTCPPSAEFPKDVWHLWNLSRTTISRFASPATNVAAENHLLVLLQFYQVDECRAWGSDSIYHLDSAEPGSHLHPQSTLAAAVDAFGSDARRALVRELGLDFDCVAREMLVAQRAIRNPQRVIQRKRTRVAATVDEPYSKKTRQCNDEEPGGTRTQLMDSSVRSVMEFMAKGPAPLSYAASTKLG
ncbi:hypothetical protein LTR17_018553 [Elasticomyces elasticus]|nr:hypothetical protein LTR17_018553 [Elasticomyces elasticus]